MSLLKLKKAAMFGLDARIALAIFGALSVISGAALYSAIQQSKVVAIATMMNEFAKAYEQYILDTGSGFPANSAHARDVTAHSLINDTGEAGWNGPYLSYEPIATYSLAINQSNVNAGYYQRAGVEAWNATSGSNVAVPCDGTRECYMWVSFHLDTSTEDKSLQKALDEYIDGGDGLSVGKFRYIVSATANQNYIRFLVGPSLRKNQN